MRPLLGRERLRSSGAADEGRSSGEMRHQIGEDASIRTTWRCCSARRFPMVMVKSDRTAKIGAQKSARGRNATNMSWRSPAKPAALDATERYAATGTGDPSYVSGAQNWKGKAETLNANPATTSRMAARARLELPAGPLR